jgi:hypothetical protein
MSSINDIQNLEEINLSQINWDMNIVEFRKIEESLQKNHQYVKNQQKDKKRSSGTILLKLRGNSYQVKQVLYEKLKKMKSDKPREKLIDEIISSHSPIEIEQL